MEKRTITFTYRRVRPWLRLGTFGSLALMALTFHMTLISTTLLFLPIQKELVPEILSRPVITGVAFLLTGMSSLCLMWLEDKAEKTLKTAN